MCYAEALKWKYSLHRIKCYNFKEQDKGKLMKFWYFSLLFWAELSYSGIPVHLIIACRHCWIRTLSVPVSSAVSWEYLLGVAVKMNQQATVEKAGPLCFKND